MRVEREGAFESRAGLGRRVPAWCAPRRAGRRPARSCRSAAIARSAARTASSGRSRRSAATPRSSASPRASGAICRSIASDSVKPARCRRHRRRAMPAVPPRAAAAARCASPAARPRSRRGCAPTAASSFEVATSVRGSAARLPSSDLIQASASEPRLGEDRRAHETVERLPSAGIELQRTHVVVVGDRMRVASRHHRAAVAPSAARVDCAWPPDDRRAGRPEPSSAEQGAAVLAGASVRAAHAAPKTRASCDRRSGCGASAA